MAVACSSDSPSDIGTAEYLTKAGLGGGEAASVKPHSGALPTPRGSLALSIPSSNVAINGGTTNVAVSSGSTIDTVYVAVDGTDGYYEIKLANAASLVPLLLTLAQELPAMQFDVVFEARDTEGNISKPYMLPTTVKEVGTGDIQVSMSWDVDNDLDLHVIDPKGREIYYDEPETPEGGELDLDSNASCDIDGVRNENIRWPLGTAPRGKYQVVVDNYENCTGKKASFTVTVQKGSSTQLFYGSFAASDHGDKDEPQSGSDRDGGGVVITTFEL